MNWIRSFCLGTSFFFFKQICPYLAAWAACSCSSVPSLLTPATISSTVHCRVAWEKKNTISQYITHLHNSQFASLIRFGWLHESSEIVLEAEKSPHPEMQPRFSFWTFGHLSSLCGARRWPPPSCGEAPGIIEEKENIKKTQNDATRLKPHFVDDRCVM